MSRTVLITGGGGFIGRALCPLLTAAGYRVRPVGRREVGAIGARTEWDRWLDGVDTVVHLAARVTGGEQDAPALLETNRDGTRALAEAAARHGVRRVVYMSSVKAVAESAPHVLTAAEPCAPTDAYGRSKLAGETAAAAAGLGELVILRPPLVYGPGVGGNFAALLRWVGTGRPLPLGAVANRRSLIFRDNLCEAVAVALSVPPGIYLPADAEAVSTAELVRRMAAALGVPARLWPMPPAVLRWIAAAAGRGAAVDRLAGSLVVDGILPGWRPRHGLDDGLAATVRGASAGMASGAGTAPCQRPSRPL